MPYLHGQSPQSLALTLAITPPPTPPLAPRSRSADHGPLNLGQVARFCNLVTNLLNDRNLGAIDAGDVTCATCGPS